MASVPKKPAREPSSMRVSGVPQIRGAAGRRPAASSSVQAGCNQSRSASCRAVSRSWVDRRTAFHCLDPAGHVEKSRGLVKEDDGALLGQHFGDEGFLAFSVAEFRHGFFRFPGNADGVHRFPYDGVVLLAERTEKARMRISAQRDQFIDTDASCLRAFRQHDADAGRKFTGAIVRERTAFDQDLAAKGTLQSAERPEQGGFSGTVVAEQRCDLAPEERQVQAWMHHRAAAAVPAGIADAQRTGFDGDAGIHIS